MPDTSCLYLRWIYEKFSTFVQLTLCTKFYQVFTYGFLNLFYISTKRSFYSQLHLGFLWCLGSWEFEYSWFLAQNNQQVSLKFYLFVSLLSKVQQHVGEKVSCDRLVEQGNNDDSLQQQCIARRQTACWNGCTIV